MVVANNDGRQLGRVRCRIEGLLTSDDVTLLPWIYPDPSASLGGRRDSTGMTVPQIGSELRIEFPHNDIYAGVYKGYWRTAGTASGAFGENYPRTYGHQDEQGTGFKVNMAKRIAELFHASGVVGELAADGTATLMSPKEITFKSLDGKTFLTLNMVDGTFALGAKGTTDLGGNEVHFSANKVTSDTGTVEEKVTGGHTSSATGGRKEVTGGGKSESVLSDKATVVGGNMTELIAQLVSQTYGLGITRTIVAGGLTDLMLAGNHAETITLGNYILTCLAGAMSLVTGAGPMSFTSGAGITMTSAAALSEIAASLSQVIAGSVSQVAGDVDVKALTGAIGLTAVTGDVNVKAALGSIVLDALLQNVKIGPNATPATGRVFLGPTTGSPLDGVLTATGNPVVDLITGAPSVPSTTVFAGP